MINFFGFLLPSPELILLEISCCSGRYKSEVVKDAERDITRYKQPAEFLPVKIKSQIDMDDSRSLLLCVFNPDNIFPCNHVQRIYGRSNEVAFSMFSSKLFSLSGDIVPTRYISCCAEIPAGRRKMIN